MLCLSSTLSQTIRSEPNDHAHRKIVRDREEGQRSLTNTVWNTPWNHIPSQGSERDHRSSTTYATWNMSENYKPKEDVRGRKMGHMPTKHVLWNIPDKYIHARTKAVSSRQRGNGSLINTMQSISGNLSNPFHCICPSLCQCPDPWIQNYFPGQAGFSILCYKVGLIQIPSGISSCATALDVAFNALDLSGQPFKLFRHLRILDISAECIDAEESCPIIYNDTFVGLENLTTLVMQGYGDPTEASGKHWRKVNLAALESLTSLTTLDLQYTYFWTFQDIDVDQFIGELAQSTNGITKLIIDVQPGPLYIQQGAAQWSALIHLHFVCFYLDLSAGLSPDAFSPLHNLTIRILDISSCMCTTFSAATFQHLSHLEVLHIENNPIGYQESNIFNLAHGLANYCNIRHLYLNYTGLHSTEMDTPEIYTLVHILNSTSLEGIYLAETHSQSIYLTRPLSNFINHLKYLTIGNSQLVSTTFVLMDLLNGLHLDTLNLSMGQNEFLGAVGVPTEILNVNVREINLHQGWFQFLFPRLKSVYLLNRFEILLFDDSLLGGDPFIQKQDAQHIPIYCEHGISGLKSININHMRLDPRLAFSINCTFPHLEELLMSENPACIKILHFPNALASMENLKIVNLTSNNIGNSNGVYSLDKYMFKHQYKMEVLLLGHNQLRTLPFDISHMKQIKLLDLSFNNILVLQSNITSMLDIISKSSNVTVDLQGNVLSCSCQSLTFVRWMAHTNVTFKMDDKFRCMMGSTVKVLTHPIMQNILLSLSSQCLSLEWLWGQLAFELISFVIITAYTVLYRFRYELQYLWLKFRIRVHQYHERNIEYFYDAFIAFNQKDYRWTRHELLKTLEDDEIQFNLCFHHRDFIVGAAIVDNIIEGLQKSRYAILVVSKESLKSEWWKCELNMAHQMSLERQHNMIICVFLEDVSAKTLPPTIGRILRLFTCLKWPQSKAAQDVFWIKLKHALRRQ